MHEFRLQAACFENTLELLRRSILEALHPIDCPKVLSDSQGAIVFELPMLRRCNILETSKHPLILKSIGHVVFVHGELEGADGHTERSIFVKMVLTEPNRIWKNKKRRSIVYNI